MYFPRLAHTLLCSRCPERLPLTQACREIAYMIFSYGRLAPQTCYIEPGLTCLGRLLCVYVRMCVLFEERYSPHFADRRYENNMVVVEEENKMVVRKKEEEKKKKEYH